ncbi:MAG: hypothetical protein M3Y93_04505 [Pseudomonadota bacterium]|nr:hypothetical protein [Pseudomonadota bacterium]
MKPIHFVNVRTGILKQAARATTFSATIILISCLTSTKASSVESLPESTGTCPANAALASLSALGSVYVGEIHGTNESPRLLECLVDYEVAAGIHPLTVSLELQPFARDTKSLVWSGQDGRTSKAMAHVVDHLETLEKSGRIALNFQLPDRPVPEHVDEEIGDELHELAGKGRVIAYGGNFHAQRRQAMLPGVTTKPAGSYMGRTIKNVLIDATGPGEAWTCSQTSCGVQKTKSFVADGTLGTMIDGKKFGYDYVYFVQPYTSSAPKFPPVTRSGH